MRLLSRGVVVLAVVGLGMAPRDSAAQFGKAKAKKGPLPAVAKVGDYSEFFGLDPFRVDNVGLVVGLKGTGSNPAPSPLRSRLLEEMRRNELSDADAEQWLASPNTALVQLRTFVPFGAREGDTLDVEVMVPRGSETTSLRGGWLLKMSLSQTARLGRRIADGDKVAVAEGYIVVSTEAGAKTGSALDRRGRILGGAKLTTNRDFIIVLADRYQGPLVVRLQNVINRRFHGVTGGGAGGVAHAKNDEQIALKVDPRYRHNVARYLEVVRNLAVDETFARRHERTEQLSRFLLSDGAARNPGAVATAALQLEGMGSEGRPVLQRVLEESQEEEVRFYVAEALAYLGDPSCAEQLGRAARDEPAYRAFALAALASLDEPVAVETLRGLLEGPSPELRYGAFRALWTVDPDDRALNRSTVGDQFTLFTVPTRGTPMLHATWSARPEVVLFGEDQRFVTPMSLSAGPEITVTGSAGSDQLVVQKPTPDGRVMRRRCAARVGDVVETVVAMGGTYADVVEMLSEAQRQQVLESRLWIDAIPRVGRVSANGRRLLESQQNAARPGLLARLPGLFSGDPGDASSDRSTQRVSRPGSASGAEDGKPPAQRRNFLGRLLGRSTQ